MRKTTLAIYKWNVENGWVYVGSTPVSEQAETIIENLRNKGIEAKIVLRYLQLAQTEPQRLLWQKARIAWKKQTDGSA